MSNIINLSALLSNEKPSIQIGDKLYPVNDGIDAVMAFQERAASGVQGLLSALETALGKEACEDIGVASISFGNLQVLATGILAAQANISYEDAAARFRRASAAAE